MISVHFGLARMVIFAQPNILHDVVILYLLGRSVQLTKRSLCPVTVLRDLRLFVPVFGQILAQTPLSDLGHSLLSKNYCILPHHRCIALTNARLVPCGLFTFCGGLSHFRVRIILSSRGVSSVSPSLHARQKRRSLGLVIHRAFVRQITRPGPHS